MAMDDGRMVEFQRELTSLGKAVASLQTSVTTLTNMMNEASQSRSGLYKQVEALRMEQSHENLQLTNIQSSLSKVQVKMQTWNDKELQAIGAGKLMTGLVKFLYVAGGAVLTALGFALGTGIRPH